MIIFSPIAKVIDNPRGDKKERTRILIILSLQSVKWHCDALKLEKKWNYILAHRTLPSHSNPAKLRNSILLEPDARIKSYGLLIPLV